MTHAITVSGTGRRFTRRPGRSPVVAGLLAIGVLLIVTSLVAASVRRGSSPIAATPTAGGPTDVTLARLQDKVAQAPDDAAAWAALGAAYVDHARVYSDPSAYPEAERALDRSLALNGTGNWQALGAQGALAAGRHDFATALRFSEQARALQPQSAFILGIIVDSLTELGRYPEAVQAAQDMVDLRPAIGSYARVSYQRELHGDVTGAIDAMSLALRAASSAGDKAFARYHLGELEWNRGDVDAAARQYESALRANPSATQPLAGLGKVAAARGDIATAIARYDEAVAGFPDPEALKELGELHLLNGDQALADERFSQAAAENARQAAGGVDINLETALFSADHARDLDQGLAAARQEWERRHSIHVADALAWQLFAHGQFDEALTYSNTALALGTRSALFHFHRAEIQRALDHRREALADYSVALSFNPNFSFLYRDAVQQAITELSAS